jgi:hypothetical protein
MKTIRHFPFAAFLLLILRPPCPFIYSAPNLPISLAIFCWHFLAFSTPPMMVVKAQSFPSQSEEVKMALEKTGSTKTEGQTEDQHAKLPILDAPIFGLHLSLPCFFLGISHATNLKFFGEYFFAPAGHVYCTK